METLPMDSTKIMSILPHRYPFLLIDTVIELEVGKRIVALKNVSMNEPFFQGHFPGHPIMPGVLILEAMAQAGGVLLLCTTPQAQGKLFYFMGMEGVKFRKTVVPGDQLRLELSIIKIRERVGKMAGKAFVKTALVAEGTFTCILADKQ